MLRMLALTTALLVAAAPPVAAATRAFPVGGFDRIRSTGPFDVRVRTGGAVAVRADGPQEVLDRLRIEVRGGELVIGTERGNWMSGWHWGKTQRPVIEVSVPMVAGTTLAGPGDLNVDRIRTPHFTATLSGPGNLGIGQLETQAADLSLSGPGNLTVAGRAGTVRVTLSGPGDVKAQRLAAQDVTVSLSGPGDVTIGAARTADVRLSGPGDVNILGNPRCTVHKSGPGEVHCGGR